ncbi:ATP-binding cassette, subfamily C, LapB [Rhodospira trueperi]|uniref:ATP-binding cassette, subfamily C, LapB n=1 Tax=Rhodospira trueperi TaxID=69960 RepID=A0A1G7FU51_9PROT|nr:ATP-binding cassette, subfamily C, LapB [Rhodospira trueperi]
MFGKRSGGKDTAPKAGKGATGAPPGTGGDAPSGSSGTGWTVRPTALSTETADPLLAALLALCRLHGRPRSGVSLTAGLPLEDNRLTPDLFPVAAARARLSARLVRRSFSAIPNHLFPVVLLLKGRTTYVVLREVKRDQFEVLLPETQSGTEIVSRRQIEERYEGYAILARPEISYRGQMDERREEPHGHWFWSTLRKMAPVYSYVILAAIMVNVFALAGPLFTMNVYDRVVPNQALETLWVLASGIIIVYVFDFALKLLRAYLIDHTGKRADVVMSSIIFGHAMNVRMGARPASSGAFANKLKEFEAVRDFFTSATVVALVDIPFIFLFIAVIYLLAGPAAYVPLIAVPVVIIGGLLLQAPLRQAVRKNVEGNAHKHGVLVEAISALDTIKSLGAEGRMQRDWDAFSGESASLGARVKFLTGIGVHYAALIQQVVTVCVVIVGVYLISNNELTMGGLIASTILTGRVMAPLGQVAGLVSRLHHAASARKSIDEIMALPVDRPRGKQFLSRPAAAGRIELQNVTFTYPGSQTPALRNVSFAVDPGQRFVIMGPVGSGKSTIARLLTRLYDPTEGSVQIDGADIQQIDPADIRRTAGVILQDIVLFTGTVRENIAMGAPEADDAMIVRAAELSGAHEFISRHPMGYDMPVGERGSFLSGGQRQAVALARALLPDPPILVLDEPTSMMDMAAEEAFVKRLGSSLKDKALIIITHRPSLLSLADRLLLLRRGEVVADGPVKDVLPALMRAGGGAGAGGLGGIAAAGRPGGRAVKGRIDASRKGAGQGQPAPRQGSGPPPPGPVAPADPAASTRALPGRRGRPEDGESAGHDDSAAGGQRSPFEALDRVLSPELEPLDSRNDASEGTDAARDSAGTGKRVPDGRKR